MTNQRTGHSRHLFNNQIIWIRIKYQNGAEIVLLLYVQFTNTCKLSLFDCSALADDAISFACSSTRNRKAYIWVGVSCFDNTNKQTDIYMYINQHNVFYLGPFVRNRKFYVVFWTQNVRYIIYSYYIFYTKKILCYLILILLFFYMIFIFYILQFDIHWFIYPSLPPAIRTQSVKTRQI